MRRFSLQKENKTDSCRDKLLYLTVLFKFMIFFFMSFDLDKKINVNPPITFIPGLGLTSGIE